MALWRATKVIEVTSSTQHVTYTYFKAPAKMSCAAVEKLTHWKGVIKVSAKEFTDKYGIRRFIRLP